jgi:hypothetical protein
MIETEITVTIPPPIIKNAASGIIKTAKTGINPGGQSREWSFFLKATWLRQDDQQLFTQKGIHLN